MVQLEQPWSMVPCLVPAAGQAIGGAVGLIKMEMKSCCVVCGGSGTHGWGDGKIKCECKKTPGC